MKKMLLIVPPICILVSGCYVYKTTSERLGIETSLLSTKRNEITIFDIPTYEYIFNFSISNISEDTIETPDLFFHFFGGNFPTGSTVSSLGEELVCPGTFKIDPDDSAKCAAKIYSPKSLGDDSYHDFYALILSDEEKISTRDFNSFWVTQGYLGSIPLFVLFYSFDIEDRLVLIGDELPS